MFQGKVNERGLSFPVKFHLVVLSNSLTQLSVQYLGNQKVFLDKMRFSPGFRFGWSAVALTDPPRGCPSRARTRSWWSGPGPRGTLGTRPPPCSRRARRGCVTTTCCCSPTSAPLLSWAWGPVSSCAGPESRGLRSWSLSTSLSGSLLRRETLGSPWRVGPSCAAAAGRGTGALPEKNNMVVVESSSSWEQRLGEH